jgi:hypothetical protein
VPQINRKPASKLARIVREEGRGALPAMLLSGKSGNRRSIKQQAGERVDR